MPAFRLYRRWAIESAALDLALRQAGRSLARRARARGSRRSTSSSRCGIGSPPSFDPVARRLEAYPWLRFKLDGTPDWDQELIDRLAATGAVASIDFKGAYKGTPVDVDTDPAFYRRIAETLPGRLARGPRPHRPRGRRRARAPPRPHHLGRADPLRRRHRAASRSRRARSTSSRRASAPTQELFAAYDYCDASAASRSTAAASPSSASGAGRSSTWPRCSIPTGVNDIAPAGYDWAEFPTGLPAQPARSRPRAHRLSPADVESSAMPPKQRQVKMESKSALAAMQKLETRSDEELEAETRFRAAAQAILGARAAERMDAKRSREHFRAAIAAARPAGAPAAAADGRGLAGARRAPPGRPQGRGREARPDPADQPPAAGPALHGPGRPAAGRARCGCGRAGSC